MQRWEIAWDAARAASKRPLRKPYKPVGPVGPDYGELITAIVTGEIPTPDWKGCRACGHHVCSCERNEPQPCMFHGRELRNMQGGCSRCALYDSLNVEYRPHAYLSPGAEFSTHVAGVAAVYVNPNDPRLRGQAPQEGP